LDLGAFSRFRYSLFSDFGGGKSRRRNQKKSSNMPLNPG
jgi:hypothetical protein